MAITYLKRAAKTPATESATAQHVVAEMLAEIRQRVREAQFEESDPIR